MRKRAEEEFGIMTADLTLFGIPFCAIILHHSALLTSKSIGTDLVCLTLDRAQAAIGGQWRRRFREEEVEAHC